MLYLVSPVRLFTTPWTVARQSPLSIGILQAKILQWVAMPSSSEVVPIHLILPVPINVMAPDCTLTKRGQTIHIFLVLQCWLLSCLCEEIFPGYLTLKE